MRPDRTNYEIWLIDYLDGNLNPQQERELISLMEENPDIKEEFEELSQYIIKPVETSFKSKDFLKKSVADLSESQFELLCVAASENDLSIRQRDEIQSIISGNPNKKKTFELINRLKLVAPDIKFNKKRDLRKLTTTQKVLRLSVVGLSAAAGIAVMVSLFYVSVKNNDVLRPLTSTNFTIDSNKVNVINNPAVVNNNNLKKQEIRQSGRISVIYTLNNIIPAETKTSLIKSAANDSSSEKQQIGQMNISKIDFIQDVKLVEKEFTSTLPAINTNNTSITEIPEKPGFINAFIAKVFREKILKTKTPESGTIKGYEIADVGINGLNKLLGWQMSLQKTRDEKGDIKSLYFSSKILKFNAPVKKEQL